VLDLEKDKRKKGQRLNLINKESFNIEIYILNKVVKVKEYIKAKDA
jgi:hypothetical protein